ncbi:hypothetical protein CIB48_g1895 [Xylaria polymorpha]|nr:hypothetical protein CIB48_g1895 [Xylaria polymorpha]
MSFSSCCLKTFTWGGTPVGKEVKLANNDSYVTGDNKDAAVLFIHDLFGWKYNNIRLLADHYAREANVTVYVPDFFDGWVVDWELVEQEKFDKIDLATMAKTNSREVRGPEMEACAKALKGEHGFKRLGAIGFCYGGWAVCHLGHKKHEPKLVDAVSMGHPSWLVKEDIENLAVPVQILAPEFDHAFPPGPKGVHLRDAAEAQPAVRLCPLPRHRARRPRPRQRGQRQGARGHGVREELGGFLV